MEKEVEKVWGNAERVRNVCVIGHVDHGKTTLTDSLLASNGVISSRLSGRVRYLDSLVEEQEKLITMKASGISLVYGPASDLHVINVIDSPGHVDFSTEVGAAVRLADGAVVVVDVVEGPCAQTQAVLRQAWAENVHTCLVLNKLDRLVTELRLSPSAAAERIQRVLEQVNVIVAGLWKEWVAAQLEKERLAQKASSVIQESGVDVSDLQDINDDAVYFAPERGNVVFASALDGWGFRINDFARINSRNLGIPQTVLQRTLWGDYALSMVTSKVDGSTKKRISRIEQGSRQPSMFASAVLANVWAIYKAAVLDRNNERTQKIVESLGLTAHISSNLYRDPPLLARTILQIWLPLTRAVFDCVLQVIPSPVKAQGLRSSRLWDVSRAIERVAELPESSLLPARYRDLDRQKALLAGFDRCDRHARDLVVFASKVFALDRAHVASSFHFTIVQPGGRVSNSHSSDSEISSASTTCSEADLAYEKIRDEDAGVLLSECKERQTVIHVAETDVSAPQSFIAFGRVFAGTLRRHDVVHVLGPKYDINRPDEHRTVVQLNEIYMLMGSDLMPVDQVPAGNIVGIGGIASLILRSATISTNPACPRFMDLQFGSKPIVTVAVQPRNPADMSRLVEGLRLLTQADSCVQTKIQDTGEHVLMCAGEVHLEHCVRDLRERFGNVEVDVSSPLVSFKETITKNSAPDSAAFTTATWNRSVVLTLRARKMPEELTRLLDAHSSTVRQIFAEKTMQFHELEALHARYSANSGPVSEADEASEPLLAKFCGELVELLEKISTDDFSWIREFRNHLWALGPRHHGPNMLLCHAQSFTSFKSLGSDGTLSATAVEENADRTYETFFKVYEKSIVNGFQMAAQAGPLCEEALMGVTVIVDRVQVDDALLADPSASFGLLNGQLISLMREGCRKLLVSLAPRIVEPMFQFDVHVPMSELRECLSLLKKRRGYVVEEDMREGSDVFILKGCLPVIESFGFTEALRSGTSGLASVHLGFSHWEVVDDDPFWVPTTEAELEEYGATGTRQSLARRLIDDVRRRKGKLIKEKRVENPEKQRTLGRNK